MSDVDAKAARAEDRAHLFYSWSAQRDLDPPLVSGASGVHFWDAEGRRYLDFASQFVHVNIGHQHPKVIAAIREQAERLCTIGPSMGVDVRARAARLIAEHAPAGMSRVFFTNGGTEAIEHATRMARRMTGRPKLLAAYRSYHGSTTTSMHLSGDPRRWPSDTGAAGVARFFGPYLYRTVFHARDEAEECARALAHLDEVVRLEGPETIAAIVLESVVGTNGILVPPDGYLAGVRAICDRYGIVYIADEVMSGFGRTGKWFAVDHWDVVPDLICFAKGVNSGYVPLGGIVIGPRVAEFFQDTPYPGGLTYSGHPLACAAAVGAITAMDDEGIVDNALRLGAEVLGPGLRELADKHPCVGDVRGLGAFWALELVADRATREPLGTAAMAAVAAACKERGLWPMAVANRIHVVPPCVTGDADARAGLAVLDAALTTADSHPSS
nr:aspartate aminotransferase family protein [Actinorhabdospora filicis]